MVTQLIPCPARRCGVENHIAGSNEAKRCAEIGGRMISLGIQMAKSGKGFGGLASAAAKSVDRANDSELDSFKGVYADSVMKDETEHAYVYDVSLETDLSDEPVVVEYTKGKGAVRQSGDPTAAEVLAALANDRNSLRQVREQVEADGLDHIDNPEMYRSVAAAVLHTEYGHSLDLDFENTFVDDDGDLMATSEAERVYDALVANEAKLASLIGDNSEILLEAVRQEEGEDFDEEGWRYSLGMDSSEDEKFEAAAQASRAEYKADLAAISLHDAAEDYESPEAADAYMAWENEQATKYYEEMEQVQGSFLTKSEGVMLVTLMDHGVDEDGKKGQEGYEIDDIDDDSRQKAENEYATFVGDVWPLVKDMDPAEVARGFLLSRNGQDGGFAQTMPGEQGEKLAKAAQRFDKQTIYVGDDAVVYIES